MRCSKTQAPLPTGVRPRCEARAVRAYVLEGERKAARCADHVDAPFNRAIVSQGNPCPCCDRGFIARLSHIDRGKCYRCGGKGHW